MVIRQLKYFISVAHHLNFTRAAEACFVVQTTMTHQIAALERELGVRLFERTKRSVALTAEGEVFLPRAEEIVKHTEYSLSLLNNMKGSITDFLHIGYWGNIIRKDLPEILSDFREENPHVSVSLTQGTVDNLLNDLRSGKLDMVFCCYFDVMEDMDWLCFEPLFDDRLYAVLPEGHPLSGKEVLSSEMIKDEPMITFPGIGAEDLCSRIGKTSSISVVEEHHKSIMMLVEAGYGITLCCERGLFGDKGRLCAIPMDESVPTVKIVACWNRERETRAASAMIEKTMRFFKKTES